MLWIKAFHIIAVVSWFAGLFYLPRIFVYHAGHADGPVHAQFCIMERKLYRYIMNPAMLATLAFGLWLAWIERDLIADGYWFHAKMALVATLVAFHLVCGRFVRAFAAGRNRRDHRFYRMFNEIPTLILVAVVILAVVKPF